MGIYGPEPDTFEGPFAPEFYRAKEVLGDDPEAMELLRSGYRPPVQYEATPPEAPAGPFGIRGDVFDNVVRSLAGQSLRSQFGRPKRGLESFGVGLAQGILDGRMLDIQRRDAEGEESAKRVEGVNAQAAKRTLTAREAAQRLAAARGEKQRAAEAAKVSLPAYIATAVGREVGERVSPDEYTRLRGQWQDAQRGEKPAPKPKPEGPSPSRIRSLKAKKATLEMRQNQLSRRIESMRKAMARDEDIASRENDLERVQADLEGVNLELGEQARGAAKEPAPAKAQPAKEPKPATSYDADATAKTRDFVKAQGFDAARLEKWLNDPAGTGTRAEALRARGVNVDSLRARVRG